MTTGVPTEPDFTETLPSVEVLLERIIDYAGLFPPASLEMAATVANYASYAAGDDAWMLGRLIVPLARIEAFEACVADHLPRGADDEPWHLSGLTAPAGDPGLEAHLAAIETFNRRHAEPAGGLARIDVIELRAGSAEAIDAALDVMPDEIYPFFELPVTEDPRGLVATLVGSDAGAKVRTGGVTPDLYPSAPDLARFIAACAATRVPFKATAGLHHPLRHHNPAVPAEEFGFLNVFVGAALAMHAGADAAALEAILEERAVDAFTFEADGLRWRDHEIDAEQIAEARTTLAVSFGSCSFEEPREDLRELRLLA